MSVAARNVETPLASVTKVSTLELSENQITDLGPLARMTDHLGDNKVEVKEAKGLVGVKLTIDPKKETPKQELAGTAGGQD